MGGKLPNVMPLDRADLYDPATDAWSARSALSDRRTGMALALLPSDEAIVSGGVEQLGADATARCRVPSARRWAAAWGSLAE